MKGYAKHEKELLEEVTTILNSGGETIVGKIYKLGDVDNYQITVPTTSGPRVLEVRQPERLLEVTDTTGQITDHQPVLRQIA